MTLSLIKLLKYVIRKLARLILWRYRPGIIGVTGSVGKTSTKIAIAEVLKGERLSIDMREDFLDRSSALYKQKLLNYQIIGPRNKNYPELLILEYAAAKPGDIRYLLSIARPNVSVVTAIGDVPVHVEFYADPEEVAREKGRLIEFLPAAGFAVLNSDDESVFDLKDRTRAHIMTFGFGRGANLRITNYEIREFEEKPIGISFKLEYGGSVIPVKIDNVFGKAQAYAAAAGAAVGMAFGLNLVKISDQLRNYRPPRGRMNLIAGQKNTSILDDSYNASPLSMKAALDTLKDISAKRKIAVLGDMTEIGKFTVEAHEEIGKLIAEFVDVLVTVGLKGKIIADSAKKAGLNKKSIYEFQNVDEAKKPVEALIRKGDLILVKASHSMRLNEVVEEIQALTEFDLNSIRED